MSILFTTHLSAERWGLVKWKYSTATAFCLQEGVHSFELFGHFLPERQENSIQEKNSWTTWLFDWKNEYWHPAWLPQTKIISRWFVIFPLWSKHKFRSLGISCWSRTHGTGSALRRGCAQGPWHILWGFLNHLCWDWECSCHSHSLKDGWKTEWWDKMIQEGLGKADKVSI